MINEFEHIITALQGQRNDAHNMVVNAQLEVAKLKEQVESLMQDLEISKAKECKCDPCPTGSCEMKGKEDGDL